MMKKVSEDPPPKAIGPYPILELVGRGGMGEVFTARDPTCGRVIVIKRVRPDLVQHEIVRKRFLKEAYIASNLNHPSIIPVFSIEDKEDALYYVMPHVEGSSLKELLRDAVEKEKENATHPLFESLSGTLRIFLNVCSALAYCHDKNILHRDVKPENILVGDHGRVYLIDWGLASRVTDHEELSQLKPTIEQKQSANLTRVGKIFGTLAYLPPERIAGKNATVLTEVYSLGVILYQLLTLRMPFNRRTMEEYRRSRKYGKPINPEEAAPLRDIPPRLAEITKKCLEEDPTKRYQSVNELTSDIEKFQEGTPDWKFVKLLDVDKRDDWELQENVLLSKLISITHSSELMEWVYLMISKESFTGNKKVTAEVTLDENSAGIGFLLNSPEPNEREGLEEGYLVWLGSETRPGFSLARSNVAIYDLPDQKLESGKKYVISIEKIDHSIRLLVDGEIVMSYFDQLPIVGTRVGLLCRDLDFKIESVSVFVGSQSAMVNCLSVPDAFLASKNFDKALQEYERIYHSFSDRKEGREALFRSGITLIEKAKHSKTEAERRSLLSLAEEKFERLPKPLNAPMASLGHSLVYREGKQLSEEIKCLELAIRRYQKHPMIHLIEEHINYRLHESAKSDREGVYQFSLLTLQHLPELLLHQDTHSLIHNLMNHTERLYFFNRPQGMSDLGELHYFMAIHLAFWLNRPLCLKEMLEDLPYPALKDVIRFSLMQLSIEKAPFAKLEKLISDLPEKPVDKHFWPIFYRIERNLTRTSVSDILPLFDKIDRSVLSHSIKKQLEDYEVWAHLLLKDFDKVEELLTNETAPFLRGCHIAAVKGRDPVMTFFENAPEFVFPPLSHLLGHYIRGLIDFKKGWSRKAFYKERIELYRQLALYYHVTNKRAKALYYERKLKKTSFLEN